MEMTHIYYVYEYNGNREHDIRKYHTCKIIPVAKSKLKDGIMTQPVYIDMMKKAKEEISEENNIELNEVDYKDIIITFWSEICHG